MTSREMGRRGAGPLSDVCPPGPGGQLDGVGSRLLKGLPERQCDFLNGTHSAQGLMEWGFCVFLEIRLFAVTTFPLDTELKPDAVWPCAALITCSAVSSCSSYLALACEDSTITVWNNCLGELSCGWGPVGCWQGQGLSPQRLGDLGV